MAGHSRFGGHLLLSKSTSLASKPGMSTRTARLAHAAHKLGARHLMKYSYDWIRQRNWGVLGERQKARLDEISRKDIRPVRIRESKRKQERERERENVDMI